MLPYTNIRISAFIGKSSLFILSAYTFGLTCHKARGSQTVGCASLRGELLVPPGGGAASFCMRDTFILNKIWTQDNIYILVETLLG
jgi:hypothetical protein